LLRATLFEISDDKVTISARQKKIGPFDAFIDSFLTKFLVVDDQHVAFSRNRKWSKGRKNKLEGRNLALSGIEEIQSPKFTDGAFL